VVAELLLVELLGVLLVLVVAVLGGTFAAFGVGAVAVGVSSTYDS
jgi:hypothetical protein